METKTQTITIFSGTVPLLRITGEKYILPYKIYLNVRYLLTVKSYFLDTYLMNGLKEIHF